MTYVKTALGGWLKPFKHYATNKSNYVTDLEDDNIPLPTMLYMTYCYFMHTVKYNAKCLFLQFGLPLCKHYFNEHSRRSGVSFVVT
jgi:hypothetical protein